MNEMMEKSYDPHAIEENWYRNWEERGYFAPQGGETAYSIMIPPPNVTGELHLGHAMFVSMEDLMIRYHRMKGDKTLWQVGTDHAGIATQMVVERRLGEDGITRQELGREKFIEKVWEWKAKYGDFIVRQLQKMGCSCDWSRERFTMDEQASRAVREAFVRLHETGKIFRAEEALTSVAKGCLVAAARIDPRLGVLFAVGTVTVIVLLAFYVVNWPIHGILKYMALCLISLAIIIAIYDLAVRRTKPTRFLFGMKPRRY